MISTTASEQSATEQSDEVGERLIVRCSEFSACWREYGPVRHTLPAFSVSVVTVSGWGTA
jgi:hypothetical protein